MILKRTHILDNCIKGFLTIEGSKFSCYTLEAACPYGKHPINRIFKYALDCGEYKVTLKPYKYHALFPYFEAKPYKNLSLIEQDNKVPRSGCIAVGSKFATEHFLVGFEDVAKALESIIYSNWSEWKDGATLTIEDDPDMQTVCDGYEEEEDNDNFNFADL